MRPCLQYVQFSDLYSQPCCTIDGSPCRYLLQHSNIVAAWLLNAAFSTFLVLGASWTVVEWAPEAAGAGVDKVMAFLNGCHMPKVSVPPLDILQAPGQALHAVYPLMAAQERYMAHAALALCPPT